LLALRLPFPERLVERQSYRASFVLPFPRSMVPDFVFFVVAVLLVVALIGLLLWFFFLRES
jgi:hypothetical protein